jgi:hypothetical protein
LCVRVLSLKERFGGRRSKKISADAAIKLNEEQISMRLLPW